MSGDPASGGPATGGGTQTGSESVEQALARARDHAASSVREAVAAIGALLDAAALAFDGEPADANRLLGPAARVLEGLRERLDAAGSGDAAALLQAVAEALDEEITRWEERARRDPDARPVLRAFLGLRELLWEFGVRSGARQTETNGPGARGARRSGRAKRRRGPRVQRVPIEG